VEEEENNFQVGDLVKYKEPRRFFTKEVGQNMIGIVTLLDMPFVKVFWKDTLWCLESLEDVVKFMPDRNNTEGS
jgi:hypothetical protein